MDVIPFFRFVGAIIAGGFMFFFLSLTLNELVSQTSAYSTGVYFFAMMTIFSLLPAVILFRSGINLVMKMQKRRF